MDNASDLANSAKRGGKIFDKVTTTTGKLSKYGDDAAAAAKKAQQAKNAANKAKLVESTPKINTSTSKKWLSSASESAVKPYTNNRPSFRKNVVEQVWENAKGVDGLVRDPNTSEIIEWAVGQPRKNVWDMGHIPGSKYSDMHRKYMNGGMTTKEFVDWYNNPVNYRPELPRNNRSHKFE